MVKYHKQTNDYTCGSTALKNIFLEFGINITEKYLRKQLGTDRNGTDEWSLQCVAEDYGFETKEVKSKSFQIFRKKIVKDLKNGCKIILLTDNFTHWISVIEYKQRKIKIVDSRYKDELNKSIVQWLTVKQLADRSHNFDLQTNKKEYYYIALILKEDE